MKNDYDVQLKEDYSWKMNRLHFHASYEVTLVISGTGEIFVDSKTYHMKRGVLMLLNNAEIHRSISLDGVLYKRYVLKFPQEYARHLSTPRTDLLRMFRAENPCIQLDEENLKLLVDLFEKSRTYTDEYGEYGDDLRRQSAFVELMLALDKMVHLSANAEPAVNKNMERIKPILTFIADHLQENLSLDIIAKQFGITKQHLCRIFKYATGMGVGAYITNERIIKACELLRNGIGVQQAGAEAGFHNNSHFIRTFKQIMGISPGRYALNYKASILM